MTPERINSFLHSFYEQYVETCYKGCEVILEDGSSVDMNQFDVPQYLINHLDIYMEHCNCIKEYSIIYNPSLFYASRKDKPEDFNQFHIYMIDNIQLFFYTILESVISETILNEKKIKKLKLSYHLIDNGEIQLLDLITAAEEKMKSKGIKPPAQG